MDIWLAILLIILTGAIFGFGGYKYGLEKGAKNREEKILQEFMMYVPLGRVGSVAQDLIDNDGYSENFPMLIVAPSKYNYLDGPDPE